MPPPKYYKESGNREEQEPPPSWPKIDRFDPDYQFGDSLKKRLSAEEDITPEQRAALQRMSRGIVDGLLMEESSKLRLFLIEAAKQKIELAQGMINGLKKVQTRLFSDSMVNAAELPHLIVMFTQACDKLLMLMASIDKSNALLQELQPTGRMGGVGQLSQIASGGKDAKEVEALSPQSRKKLQIAFKLVLEATKEAEKAIHTAQNPPASPNHLTAEEAEIVDAVPITEDWKPEMDEQEKLTLALQKAPKVDGQTPNIHD